MREDQDWSLGREDPLEKEMAIHSSTIAWRIPWAEEPGRLQSMGSQRVRHDWATSLHFMKKLKEEMERVVKEPDENNQISERWVMQTSFCLVMIYMWSVDWPFKASKQITSQSLLLSQRHFKACLRAQKNGKAMFLTQIVLCQSSVYNH